MEAAARVYIGLYWGRWEFYPPIIDNQMEKNMENEIETGICKHVLGLYRDNGKEKWIRL